MFILRRSRRAIFGDPSDAHETRYQAHYKSGSQTGWRHQGRDPQSCPKSGRILSTVS